MAIASEQGERLLAGMSESERLDSWHLVEPGGRIHSGGGAAAPLAELLPGGRPLAIVFRTFPGLTERAYRLVANNRDHLARALRIDSDYRPRAR